jgi:hypothetical protein
MQLLTCLVVTRPAEERERWDARRLKLYIPHAGKSWHDNKVSTRFGYRGIETLRNPLLMISHGNLMHGPKGALARAANVCRGNGHEGDGRDAAVPQ